MAQHDSRILLIDDNRHGLLARRMFLEDHGYEVATAAGGRRGVELLQQQPFDLVVTDFRMPDLDGCKVTLEARQLRPGVPVVILSGYASKLGLTEQTTGADAVLSKGPSELQDLARAVARLLKKKKAPKKGPAAQRRPPQRPDAAQGA